MCVRCSWPPCSVNESPTIKENDKPSLVLERAKNDPTTIPHHTETPANPISRPSVEGRQYCAALFSNSINIIVFRVITS